MQPHQRISYSQFGEDLAIEALLQTHRRIAGGTYVDVGAFDPWKYSNTALLHTQHGWSGLNIDANAAAIDEFKVVRPNDVNVVGLVGRADRAVEYVKFDHPGVNSADPAMIARQSSEQSPFREIGREVMRPTPLSELLDAHLGGRQIDLLTVDAEGMDLEVLETNDWARYLPFLIAVEVHSLSMTRWESSAVHRYLSSLGYLWVSHVFVTSFFIHLGAPAR